MLVLELGRKSQIDYLTFSPDGRSLVAASEWSADRWHAITDGQLATRLLYTWCVCHAQQTPGGRWLFAGRSMLWRIDLATGERSSPTTREGSHFVQFDVSPTEPLVLIAWQPPGTSRTTRLTLCRADDLSPAGQVWEREFDKVSSFRPQFLTGGDRFVRLEGGWSGDRHSGYRVAVYDTTTGEPVGESGPINTVRYDSFISPDGRWVATRDASAIVLCPTDPAGGRSGVLKNDSRKHFTGIAFHSSGKYIAATSNDTTVKFYDTTTWTVERTFTWNIGKMRSIAFSPDGTLAAVGSDKGQVVIWDVDE